MDEARDWIRLAARTGYAARGLVYLIIGLFAVLAATGSGENKDSKDALHTVLEQPFGTALVWCMVAGLAGYVIWRLIQGLLDADQHGHSVKGLAIRAGLLVSAFTYATLAAYALSLLGVFAGGGGDGGSGGAKLAPFLSGIVGQRMVSLGLAAIFLGVAGAHLWKAVQRKYADHFDAPPNAMKLIHPVSIMGLCARGFVLAVIALLFFYRFMSAEEGGERPGLEQALEFVQSLPGGAMLLAATGLGLIAFAAYSMIEARWRNVRVRDAAAFPIR